MKRLLCAVMTIALILALCACASGGGGVVLTDSLGREVTLDKLPTRIVDMVPGDVEIIYALGAQDLLVGVGEYCYYPEQAQDLPSLGTGANTSVEQIIALAPELVIMGTMGQDKAHADALEAAGIPVMISAAETIEQTYALMEQLGQITNKKNEAERLVTGMKAQFEELAGLVAEGEKKRAYIEVSPLEYGLWTCGANTFVDEVLTAAGLYNIFGDLEGWQAVSQEQVIARNPEVILTISMGYEGFDPQGEIASRPGWESIAAVAEGMVLVIDPDASSRPGPRLADAAAEIYEMVYGPR